MKVLIIGGTGTIGKAVVSELSPRHTMVTASRQGDVQVDMTDVKSIEAMYEKVGHLDAVVCTAGKVKFESLTKMSASDYAIGLQDKLMGQVNLVLIGLRYMNDNGSFTLTSGILNHDPIRMGSSAAMVNGALEGFVKSAAIEAPRGIRINVVSPTVLAESMEVYQDYFRGFNPVPVQQVAFAYAKSVEGAQTGQVYKVGY